jgi:hypothetical protein
MTVITVFLEGGLLTLHASAIRVIHNACTLVGGTDLLCLLRMQVPGVDGATHCRQSSGCVEAGPDYLGGGDPNLHTIIGEVR